MDKQKEEALIRDLLPKGLSQKMIADACGVSQQAVNQWLSENRVPAKRVKAFHDVSGIAASRLNPAFSFVADISTKLASEA